MTHSTYWRNPGMTVAILPPRRSSRNDARAGGSYLLSPPVPLRPEDMESHRPDGRVPSLPGGCNRHDVFPLPPADQIATHGGP